ncbi:GNAT family N-acetyltransferase [Aeromicrobium sp. A1-2]|uniref:GNAT family N-acetyltransferase n=1 Tax=Aeromicrobium sp. A1-2 TaxID=2107713 RepID=UPI000E509EDC|nr:GNAT family N-acetyltransferase [Aeromicrobium sp. A1-2]AXT85596.1 GNAT family N-acetyltransferase [Aeromicrobium sp. A1-2]
MLVRPARADEHVAVGELTVAGYDADGYLTLPDGTFDHEYGGWLVDAAPRGQADGLLVAVEEDELLGTVTWCPYGSPFAQLATEPNQGELRTLSVAPHARRLGVGRALVAACLDRARAEDLTEVVLCSLREMLPAHRLYESFGFTRRPELDLEPLPGVDLWAFSLRI